ncbi:MAG: MFS transporter [Thermoleophilia bacterium]
MRVPDRGPEPRTKPVARRAPFYAFLAAEAVSLVGNNITMVAVPWFVLVTTGSATKTGLVGFFTALPAVISGLFGGTLVDRVGHRRMSIVADLASGATVVLIPLLHNTVGLRFWQMLLIVFASALLDVPGNTARFALLPDVSAAADVSLERANAAQQMIHRGGTLVGPAIAGVLITWLGASNVLYIDAATFAFSAGLFFLAVPAPRPAPGAPDVVGESYLSQLKAGLRYLREDRLIRAIVIMVSITNFLDAPVFAVLLPVYARDTLGTAAGLGFMIAAFGAGAVLSALAFGAVGARLPRRLTFITAFAVASTPFWVLAASPPYPVAVASLFVGGLVAGSLNPMILTVAQERIPREMRGRVFGLMMAVAFAAAPLGMVLAGYLAETISVTTTLLVIAIAYVVATTAQYANPALREMDRPRRAGPDEATPE